MENTQLFSGKSEDYFRYRPSYPETAVRWLREKCAGEHVADIGAGTGIFTKLLQPFFKEVCAVEPNADMREIFCRFLPDVYCSAGSGEESGLASGSVDLITVAQAFHWLSEDRFKAEALRILRPAGKVAIIWNSILESDFTLARSRVCQKYCPRFRSGHAGKRSAAEGDDFLRNHYFREVEVVSFANPFEMDLEIFEGNMRSRSYALTPDDPAYADFSAELRSVFEQYAVNGIVTDPQETQIYLGRF
jgi:SAM-dependent methyltransferase